MAGMRQALVIIALLNLPAAAAATEPPVNPRMQRFNEDFTRTGEFGHCVALSRLRSTRVLDGEHILFRLNGNRYFLNTLPRRCPRLGYVRSFGYVTSISKLCDLDSITVIDDITQIHRRAGGRVAFLSGPRCSLGKFERVEKVQKSDLAPE